MDSIPVQYDEKRALEIADSFYSIQLECICRSRPPNEYQKV
jgi:hypothetical protein